MPVPSPPLVPGFDTTVYIVLDDFGRGGRSYREVDEEKADLETVIRDLIGGQYEQPVRVPRKSYGRWPPLIRLNGASCTMR